jgi:hypothetical protein
MKRIATIATWFSRELAVPDGGSFRNDNRLNSVPRRRNVAWFSSLSVYWSRNCSHYGSFLSELHCGFDVVLLELFRGRRLVLVGGADRGARSGTSFGVPGSGLNSSLYRAGGPFHPRATCSSSFTNSPEFPQLQLNQHEFLGRGLVGGGLVAVLTETIPPYSVCSSLPRWMREENFRQICGDER